MFGTSTKYTSIAQLTQLLAFGVARLIGLLEDFMLHALDVLSVIIALGYVVISTGSMVGFALVNRGGKQGSDGSEPFI